MNNIVVDVGQVHATITVDTATPVTVSTNTPVIKEYKEREIYEGTYDLTPSFKVQTLATKGLVMSDNVTVNQIGVSITENLSGGNTVYIGPF